MHHEIHTKVDGLGDVRGDECRVNGDQRTCGMRLLSQASNVANFKQRIAGSFDPQQIRAYKFGGNISSR